MTNLFTKNILAIIGSYETNFVIKWKIFQIANYNVTDYKKSHFFLKTIHKAKFLECTNKLLFYGVKNCEVQY
jgi:hypothetical protein